MLLIILILLVLFGGFGGGYIGRSRWDGNFTGGAGIGLGTILLIILIVYLLGGLPRFY